MVGATEGKEELEEESNGFLDEIISYVTDLNIAVPVLLTIVTVYIGYKYLESRKRVQASMMFPSEETNTENQGQLASSRLEKMLEPAQEIEQYTAVTKRLENNIKSYNEYLSSRSTKELTLPFRRAILVQRCKHEIGIAIFISGRKPSIKARHEAGKLSEDVMEAYQKMELAFLKENQDVEALAKELEDPKKDPKEPPFYKTIWQIAKAEAEAEHEKLQKENQARLEEEAKKKREKNKEKKKKQKEKAKAKKDEERKIQDEEERKKVTRELLTSYGLENLLEKEPSKETKENEH